MPDADIETPISTSPDAKTLREDILNIVGLSADAAKQIADKEAKNILRLETARKNGRKVYSDLKEGIQIEQVTLGSGQFPITPVDSPRNFVAETVTRSREINPPPPNDEVNEMLEGIAEEALKDPKGKEFETAVACYNYITDEKLRESEEHIKKLKTAAVTDQEKYELYKTLTQVVPEEIKIPELPKVENAAQVIPANTATEAATPPAEAPKDEKPIVINNELQGELSQIAQKVDPLDASQAPKVDAPPIIAKDDNLLMPDPPIAAVTSGEQVNTGGLLNFGSRILRPVQKPTDTTAPQEDKIAA